VGTDCDDLAAEINPGAIEACDDIDNDCDGAVDGEDEDFDTTTLRTFYLDEDADGYGDPDVFVESCSAVAGHVERGDDCDDGRADVNPEASEVCDTDDTDEDCDGLADDADDSTLEAGMTDVWADVDGDSFGDPEAGARFCDPAPGDWVHNGDDCDDGDGLINPDVDEICDPDNVDEDCSDAADDADPGVDSSTQSPHFADSDGDGHGDPAATMMRCDPGSGYVAVTGDCNDGDRSVHPGATEICDAADVDEDCDGLADDADSSVDPATQLSFYEDADGDGYGDAAGAVVSFCDGDAPEGRVTDSSDCDDDDSSVHPGATEICDGDDIDEDCDGLADDSDASVDATTQETRYTDGDGDGFGDASDPATAYCDPPSGSVSDNTDCDDADAGVHPDATEVCDSADTDENCNSLIDDADGGVDTSTHTTFYRDSDSDTYGDPGTTTDACDAPSGYVADNTDCDDTAAGVNPGETEVCDPSNTDEDCNSLADDADSGVDPTGFSTFYQDSDTDTYGNPSTTTTACDPPTGYVADSADCNDASSAINPSASEVCDSIDNDCDGDIDDADASLDTSTATEVFTDSDGDGFGDDSTLVLQCNPSTGLVFVGGDCDDGSAAVNPAATEVCDGVDNDCDGDIDVDAIDGILVYADGDGDGYGSITEQSLACEVEEGFTTEAGDCDDATDRIYPGAPETCDGVDRDCDGVAMAPESVIFIDETGNIEDMSAAFASAGPEAPQDILLDRVGELRVCPTTLYATISIESDVTIRAVGGREATVIDAGRAGTVVDIAGDGLDVVIEGMTLRGGQGEQGGGISCAGFSELTLFDTAVRDSHAREGGGIYSDRCTVEAHGLHLHANRAVGDGAGMVVDGGSAWIEGAFIGGNHAEASAGGLFVRSNRADSRVQLVDTMFQNNESADYAGGLAVESLGAATASVEMVCTEAETGGFIGNRSQDGAHFGIHANDARAASLTMDGCSLNREDSAGQGVIASDTEVKVYTELDGAAVDCDGVDCR
jgi:hypothetical protein